MARTLYSKVLWAQVGSTSGSGLVIGPVVPTGYIWDVRDIVAIAPGTSADAAGGFTITDGSSVPIMAVDPLFGHGGGQYHWEGRQILNEADWLQKISDVAHWSWRISGYQLTIP